MPNSKSFVNRLDGVSAFQSGRGSSLKREQRNSNIEMLRIVSMVLIVVHHYSLYGASRYSEIGLTPASFFLQALLPVGKVGVNCFVLITGFFACRADVDIRRLVYLYAKVWCYSVGCFLICTFLRIDTYSHKGLLRAILPLTSNAYWFINIYMVLMLASPYLNRLLNAVSQREHASCAGIMILLWCVWPTLLGQAPAFTRLGWFVALYVFGAYVARFPGSLSSSRRFWLIALTGGIFAFIIPVLGLDLLSESIGHHGDPSRILWEMNNIPAFVVSISLLMLSLGMPRISYRFINTLAASMTGVYLLHESPSIRTYLWGHIFDNSRHLHFPQVLLHALWSAFTVFIVCVLIDVVCVWGARLLFTRIFQVIYGVVALWCSRLRDWIYARLSIS